MRTVVQLGAVLLAAGWLAACSENKNSTATASCVASPNASDACLGFAPPPPGYRPGLTVKPPPPALDVKELQCFGTPYGVGKRDYAHRTPINGAGYERPSVSHLTDLPTPSPRIVIQSTSLGMPPEIRQIERGYFANWVGGFINDGMASWSGIDLDRREAISVQRRIYDSRAKMSRPFDDPIFNDWDHVSFARKWSTDQRTEMEVVTRRALTPAEIQAFVCVANGVWSGAEQKSPQEPMMRGLTDTLVNQATLLDRTEEEGRMVAYTRAIEPESPLAWTAAQIFGSGLPRIDWPMRH